MKSLSSSQVRESNTREWARNPIAAFLAARRDNDKAVAACGDASPGAGWSLAGRKNEARCISMQRETQAALLSAAWAIGLKPGQGIVTVPGVGMVNTNWSDFGSVSQ